MKVILNGIEFCINRHDRGQFTVEGPAGVIETYSSTPNAYTDVLCAHLGVVGGRGLIDHATANVSRDEIDSAVRRNL